MPGFFKGYYKGYSVDRANPNLATSHNLLTWLVMKAHTKNRAGTVKLRSANPLDVPEINFHYFYEGTDRDTSEDLDAIVEGFKFARRINEIARTRGVVKREIWPGPEQNVEDDDSIRRRQSWSAPWNSRANATANCWADARVKTLKS